MTVAVNPASAGQVETGFAGFSYEKTELGAGLSTRATPAWCGCSACGANVLRIGGNTNDRINWNPNGAGGSTGWVPTFAPTEKPHGLGPLSAHMYVGNQTTGTIAGMLASTPPAGCPTPRPLWGRPRRVTMFHSGG